MATRSPEAQVSLLDDRIDILKRDVAKYPPTKEVFEIVIAILALVQVSTLHSVSIFLTLIPYRWPDQEKAVVHEESVQLSDYCFEVCEALKVTIQEENADHLSAFARMALQDVGRCVSPGLSCPYPCLNCNSRSMREIERTLRTGASMPGIKYDRGKIEGEKQEIQRILDVLNRQSSSADGDGGGDERALQSSPLDSHGTIMTSVPENGRSRPRVHRSCVER